jgi:hypothetical protein
MTERESKICSACGEEITPRDNLVICNGCDKPYHMHCWSKAGRCQTYGCEGKPVYHPAAETVQQPPQQSPSIAGDVPNYLVWAILATIFCCIPFGIVAIVYSSQVSGHLAAGNYEAALKASSSAKKWCLAATITGAVLILIYSLVMLIPLVLAIIQGGSFEYIFTGSPF